MITADNLKVEFSGRVLFDDLSFTLRPGDRLSLAGPNGAGKSTLMKVLCGHLEPNSGKIVQGKTAEVGYLPQEGVHHEGRTLFAEAETAFAAVLKLQGALDELSEQLGILSHKDEKYHEVLEEFGDLQLRLQNHDPARMRPKIERILMGLGFKQSDFERDTGEFSGGWQMRIALAKLLLREPDLLLLDEPTNHLDIETIQWLENYLKQYPGSVLLISHDRRFLDELTNRTLAFENGKVETYSGNYSWYLKERIARREQLERAYVSQQKEIAKAEAFINRFRAQATKARQVQSRIKQLAKVERIQLPEDVSSISFRFPQPPPSGQKVMEVSGVTKSYGGPPIFQGLDYRIERGDRIAIVGVNGAGKSTFARLIAGQEPFDSGEREVGHKVEIGYFAQDHADKLDKTKTVQEMAAVGLRGESAARVRDWLGAFLFRGDDVHKSVSVLSGGERGRLALVRMLLRPANFLILDEPTNHLDMASQSVMQKALEGYTGSYMIVSHNRDFLDPIVNKVLEFRVGEPPRTYLGNVSYYIEKKREEEAAAATSAAPAPSGSGISKPAAPKPAYRPKGKDARREAAQLRQQRAAAIKPLQEKLETVEKTIAGLEAKKIELTTKVSDPEVQRDPDLLRDLAAQFQKANDDLNSAYSEWSEASEAVEEAEAKLGGS